MASPADNRLQQLRDEIDGIDEQLVRWVAQRMQRVAEIGELKRRGGDEAILDPAREAELQQRWLAAAARHDLSRDVAVAVLEELLRWSRSSQRS